MDETFPGQKSKKNRPVFREQFCRYLQPSPKKQRKKKQWQSVEE
jgi:hypothetical protein